MLKPRSPMCQVMRSALSGMMALRKSSSASPSASAVTRAAAQPSPNSRNERIVSSSAVSCMCRVHSSRLTTSTRDTGSARTASCAARNAGIAAEQPMKPITLRLTVAARPSRQASCKSRPGAENPVQDATIRCVMRWRSRPMSSAEIARSASAGAHSL